MEPGDVLRSLFLASPRWVHRRVQTISNVEAGSLKLQCSLDVTPPAKATIPSSKGCIIIPIAVMRKETMVGWWVEDSSGHPLSVINRNRSSELVLDMLISALKVIGLEPPRDAVEFSKLFSYIDNGDVSAHGTCTDLLEYFFKDGAAGGTAELNEKEHARRELVRELAMLLQQYWIVLVEVPVECAGRRIIIRYGYDLPAKIRPPRHWRNNNGFSIDIDDAGFSMSLHHEVHVAPEAELFDTSLRYRSVSGEMSRVFDKNKVRQSKAHIQTNSYLPRFGRATLEFRVRPFRGGIRSFTLLATGAVMLSALITGLIPLDLNGVFLQESWRETTSAAVILVLPALLLSWMARAPEPLMVEGTLIRLRLINLLLAASILFVATALSTLWQPVVWHSLWGGRLCSSFVCTFPMDSGV